MRTTASILHLDLDAFFASVEQRDKPSLRGKPVIVGGLGARGVVSTASYEARVFGVHSAMSMAVARRLAPHAAYLSGRFDAYRQSSRVVMALLAELSPLVEPLSLDEAYVDLAAGGIDCSTGPLDDLVRRLRAEVTRRTDGLTASVGVGSSRFIAKIGSESAKPDGYRIVTPGTELELISPLRVESVPGIGPATRQRLTRLGIHTVADLQQASVTELSHELGPSAGQTLHQLAFAQDDRPVQAERETKSISVEDTFETDRTDADELGRLIDRDASLVAERMVKAGLFARTITLKMRLGDFTTYTRSRTLEGATDRPDRIAAIARRLLAGLDYSKGVRLLGVGVSGFTEAAQEELFELADDTTPITEEVHIEPDARLRARQGTGWPPGAEVEHAQYGRGWVWGSGQDVVTVRFETRFTGVGPVRSIPIDDPDLRLVHDLLPLTGETAPNPNWRTTTGAGVR